MAKSQGINRVIAYNEETTFGVIANALGASQIRRVSADLSLSKETYQSEEIRTDYQVADMRHGVRSVDGSISGELSPGTYADFFEAILARDFSAVVGTSTAEVTIAASGANFTITRSDLAGDYLADGIKVGHVVRMTGAGLNAANVGNNLLVISVSATVLTVKVLSSTALVAEGPIASVNITPAGKVTEVPQTGHTDKSFTFESWFSDISESEVYTGVKFNSASVSLPATGLVTVDFGMMGKDLAQTGATQYFTTPAAAGTNGILASVQGALLVNGSEAGCITSADISISREIEGSQCVGQNSVSDMFVGRITVTGSLSAYFSDGTLRDYFDNETEVTVVLALTASEDKAAHALSFVLPRVKFCSATNADAELGITQNIDFTALLNTNVATGLANSTIQIQDTSI